MLLFVVISGALVLVPQDVELLGAEILVIAVPLTVITFRSQLKFQRHIRSSRLDVPEKPAIAGSMFHRAGGRVVPRAGGGT